MPEKLTEPQKRALAEIGAGRVIYVGIERRYRSTVFPPAVRTPTIERVIALGLATPTDVASMVALTARGREVLRDE